MGFEYYAYDASSKRMILNGVISNAEIWMVLSDTLLFAVAVVDFDFVLYLKTFLYTTDIILFHIPFHALTAPFFMHPRPPTHSPK